MNKKILLQVLKNKELRKFIIQFVHYGHGKVGGRLSNKKIKCDGCEEDVNAIIEDISLRTIELVEEEFEKGFLIKVCDKCGKQKADFRKMIEEYKNSRLLNQKDDEVYESSFMGEMFGLDTAINIIGGKIKLNKDGSIDTDKLLAKLGTNHSQVDKSKSGGLSHSLPGTSKGCGKRLPTKQRKVRDSLVCNQYQLCKSCQDKTDKELTILGNALGLAKKEGTCICRHDKEWHKKNADMICVAFAGGYCKCKKFQEAKR